jgi:hypothetical protein
MKHPHFQMEDIAISPPFGNEGASYVDPSAGVVEGSTVDWIGDAAVPQVNLPMDVQTSNAVL